MPRPPFTQNEIEYILENADIMSQAEIAENLSKLYPGDNAGKRTRSGVHNILQKIRREESEED